MQSKVRTRYAPSPTGFQHIGGVRTALYCYLFAKKHNGIFILRIEDTDQKRYVAEAEQYITDTLKWLNLIPDESDLTGGDHGPYKQSNRFEYYQKYGKQLLEEGHAYYAFDTPEELNKMREDFKDQGIMSYNSITRKHMTNSLTLSKEEVDEKLSNGESFVVRLKVPEDQTIIVNDIIRGEVVVQSKEIDDKVIIKGDGMPTYHLANVVDDHLMEISHVIRGEEWLPSTPLHVLLYRYLGWEKDMPEFAHLPLILKPDGKGKLSKRDGDRLGFPVFPLAWETEDDKSNGYRELGFQADAFINYLAFLGWNLGTEQEIFSIDELIAAFSLDRIGRSGAKFDFEKAKWFNQQHLQNASDKDLVAALTINRPEEWQSVSKAEIAALLPMFIERMTFTKDFFDQAKFMITMPEQSDMKTIRKKWKENSEVNFQNLSASLTNLDSFCSDDIEQLIKNFIEENGLSFGEILLPMRLMLTGIKGGPSLFDIMEHLGKEETLNRIHRGISDFNRIATTEV